MGRIAASGCSTLTCGPTATECTVSVPGCSAQSSYYVAIYGSSQSGCVIQYTFIAQSQGIYFIFSKNFPRIFYCI